MTNSTDFDHRFDVAPTVGSHFAWLNSRLAVERTFLAWIRTSIALIGFGFTIVQFFQRLESIAPKSGREMRSGAPRDLGLALIICGVGALFVAMLEYRWGIKYLWHEQYKSIAGISQRQFYTPAYFSAYVLMFIGIIAFISVFVRFP